MSSHGINEEPLTMFCNTAGFDPSMIMRYEIGEKYVGIMLMNGHIGVCATLGEKVTDNCLKTGEPALDLPGDRIILNAWFNSLFNYDIEKTGKGDIFNYTRFTKYKNIVMIGNFDSLVRKFREKGINANIFDKLSDVDYLVPMGKQSVYLAEADCVILTGTTISNGTFLGITNSTPDKCDILLLGPSNILHNTIFLYRNIKVVFGSRFEAFDHSVLDIIRNGYGTKSFLKDINKVYISAP